MRRPYLFPGCDRRGSILIFAVWILVFFSILSVAVFGIINSQAKLVKNIESRIIGCQLANAAIYYVRDELKQKAVPYISLSALKQERKKELGLGEFDCDLTDELGKLDLNSSTAQQLTSLPGIDT
ncbi:MAG: hypothetical protein NTY47_04130, partial [Candidatus Omnitrophica bacterium]|nr:hypothetical protein [Candidatus Omnitrophota bacterium]